MAGGSSDRAPQHSRDGALVFYATRDGQSRCIAVRIVDRLIVGGIGATAYDLATAAPASAGLEGAPFAVLVAAVRHGRHLPEANRFLSWYGALSAPPPLALASVNLTARKPGRSTADGNPYLRKMIARSGIEPVLAIAFAGRLDYARYGWLDRQIIRCIMFLTGGPTDPNACVVYTSWDAVDAFAARLAQLHQRRSDARPVGGDRAAPRFTAGSCPL